MDVILRTAVADDLAELTAIAGEAKRHWNYPEALLAQWSSALTLDERSLIEMHVVVADVLGLLQGFCAVVPGPARFQLEHLWVRPHAMGLGLGRKLLEYAIDYARSAGATELVIDSDPNAEAFYVRMGAVRVGSVPAPVACDPTRELPRLEIALGNGEASNFPARGSVI